MVFFHNTPHNVVLLEQLTGIPASVANAWLICEGQEFNNPSNPLNILHYPNDRMQIGGSHGFGIYNTPDDGIRDAARTLNQLSYYEHVRAVIHNKASTAYQIARAIELSPWAEGNYGATQTKNGCISNHLHSSPTPTPTPTPTTRLYYTVRAGDNLTRIAARFHITLKHLIELNPQIHNINLIHPGDRVRVR